MTRTSHWGITVDSETPITGVAQNNHIEWLSEEIDKGIDLDYEAYMEENPEAEDYESMGDSTVLIGSWKKNDDGKYEPDTTGDYAAIVGEIYTQVVYSHNVKRCALCSPCYPGQGDLDSDGLYLAYDLPADMYDNEES